MQTHTLGPTTTDSYRAAEYFKKHIQPDTQIVLHDDFADIYPRVN